MDITCNNEKFIFSKINKNDAYLTITCSNSTVEIPE